MNKQFTVNPKAVARVEAHLEIGRERLYAARKHRKPKTRIRREDYWTGFVACGDILLGTLKEGGFIE